ncbi:SpoIVB peptidase [Domibacillus epiphyticus]|uniref:SpoIVB peptidase n=1 Tax=Domibacillus epiphyticus TaxID=1714355 RepID=A0A1V2A9U4_9BACI|nr:SpoIVB peptidase [Domibacillus epiphyticus]OMP67720.1 SpoIVB peptidase [Domibacillus epiphyticus]
MTVRHASYRFLFFFLLLLSVCTGHGTVIQAQTTEHELLQSAGFPAEHEERDRIFVVPGGQSVGLQLQTKGLYVVGFHFIGTANEKQSPGESSGLLPGDVIVSINNEKVTEPQSIRPFVQSAGEQNKPLQLSVLRGKKTLKLAVTPVKDTEANTYKLGVYIKNRSAGIGTLTFYDPKSKKYGALGHVISDVQSGQPFAPVKGTLHPARITGIQKATEGVPGEKTAVIPTEDKWGTVTANTPFGIFGRLQADLQGTRLYPAAHPDEVVEGPAEIWTVTENEKVETFKVSVTRTIQQTKPGIKGMIIKMTDPRLIGKTGGIVQGMSGSPIIQNGRIIGAVTHVFVNDPLSGYGVHINWMLKDAGIM